MNSLTTDEIAWLVGGARRVALVTFVSLATDGRLEVAYRRQRVTVARKDAADRVSAVALALVPESGLRVDEFIDQVAATKPVTDLNAAVLAKGHPRLLRWLSPAFRALVQQPGTGLRRVAILGVPGVEDERLRDILEHPRPEVPKFTPHKAIADNSIDGTIGPDPNIMSGP
jgi:uncharacterized protein (TIGR04222 family)